MAWCRIRAGRFDAVVRQRLAALPTGPANESVVRRKKAEKMTFQAYLDNIEQKTGLTPRQLVDQARERGYDAPGVKSGVIVDWLKADYDLRRGHAMALVHVIKNGPKISTKHVGSTGPHRDDSDTLWLDGKATNPST